MFLLIAFAEVTLAQDKGMMRARITNSIVEKNIKFSVGLNQGAVNMGGEYESRIGSSGYSGYFLLATEKASVNKPQMMIIGGGLPIYFFDNRSATVSVTPGFGLNMIKMSNQNETAIGAQLKLSASIFLSANLRAGLEHFILTNWINEKAGGDQSLTHVIFTFSL